MNWILSKLFPYSLPSKLGIMLAAEGMVTYQARRYLK